MAPGLFVLEEGLDLFNGIYLSKVFVASLYFACLGTNCTCFKMFLSDSHSLTSLKVTIFLIFTFLMTDTTFIH